MVEALSFSAVLWMDAFMVFHEADFQQTASVANASAYFALTDSQRIFLDCNYDLRH